MKTNTKFNKILSSALVLVMLFASLVVLFPAKVDAAYSDTTASYSTSTDLKSDDVKKIVKDAYTTSYESAEEMLEAEKALGYLDSVTKTTESGDSYTIYVNRYTGVLYYVNNVTGQILTSNPYEYSAANDVTVNQELLSQISIDFKDIATNTAQTYNSTVWAALYTQISTSFIDGGIRVKYTLGDTTARFLLPGRMKAEKFERLVLLPMLEEFVALVTEYLNSEKADREKIEEKIAEIRKDARDKYNKRDYSDWNFNVFEDPDFSKYDDGGTKASNNNIYYLGYLNSRAIKGYLSEMELIYKAALNNRTDEYRELSSKKSDIIRMLGAYNLQNMAEYEKGSKEYDDMIKEFYTPSEGTSTKLEIFETLEPMYTLSTEILVNEKRINSNLLRKYIKGYTFSEMFADEKECGYVDKADQKPVFRCALEYTFNDDGSLSVRLPANSISFDDTVYNLLGITPLKYFGAGDMAEEGYIFYPDGSGTIIEFDEYYNDYDKSKTSGYASPFGNDYAYSTISGAHEAQITMPVYGVVSTEKANAKTAALFGVETVTNGYFAVLEEGASLATIGFETGGSSYRFGEAYCQYSPYPSDTYDLSETLSVGNGIKYTIVSDCDYNGSYVTRIVMLTDPTVGNVKYGAGNFYPTTYVGMATCYRDLLEKQGSISPLELVSNDLPLYIEALGSMEVIEKVLSFPITKSVALTEFEQIEVMYKELSDAVTMYTAEAAKYEELAASEEDEVLKAEYTAIAESYRELVGKVETIENINFRLTGFGNGGLYSTYPTKVRWDRSCGGKRAFKKLVAAAKEYSAKEGTNFGIYPEYDFMYISYTEIFDGVTIRNNVSRMVDNRYASKQEYDSVLQEFVSYYTLVVNPESLDKLYTKFEKKYSKYDIDTLSVSTLGSDLNSNFDEDEPVNRNDAEKYVESLLSRMVNDDGYKLMTDVGNIYSVKYATHILNASIDSSHLAYASYTVPFVGMILHGSVNYAGSPLNYSGMPNYELLRSIESGASLYYIVCYQNSALLKEDVTLSDYYGVDYNTWKEDILTTYKTLNTAIGDLQGYKIVDHQIILGERVITDAEMARNYDLLKAEIIEMLDAQLASAVNEGYKELAKNEASYGRNLAVVISAEDRNALLVQFSEILNLDVAELGADFVAGIDEVIAYYTTEYAEKGSDDYKVTMDSIVYESEYSFITDSEATDGDEYKYTDFTSDVNNIALVTYSNGTDTVQFVLNYNMYSVEITLNGVKLPVLGEYGCIRIDKEGVTVI